MDDHETHSNNAMCDSPSIPGVGVCRKWSRSRARLSPSASAHALWLLETGSISVVLPSLLAASTSAPAANRNETQASWPLPSCHGGGGEPLVVVLMTLVIMVRIEVSDGMGGDAEWRCWCLCQGGRWRLGEM